MITARDWAGKRYAVLGLARSGAAVVRSLVASGASVVAWDVDAGRREAVVGRVQELSVSVDHDVSLEIADPELIDLTEFDALVVSPGVPLNRHPVAAKARAAGVPIIGDIELFSEARGDLPAHRVVGVTGTNGKSTTVSLIHHILETAGVPSRLGGNIGLPILEQAPLPEGGVYVLELSSYQIDLTQTLDCEVAVLLNITPDHLDRYDGFEAYAASKARLFEMQAWDHDGIFGIDDPVTSMLGGATKGEIDYRIGFSYTWYAAAADVSDNQREWPALQGPHNAQNAAAAVLACQKLGVSRETIDAALQTFTGLPHRMERIAFTNGVAFVNDSKATNPESVAPALAAFERVHWILGGQAKSDDLSACAPSFGHVVRVYAIGDAGERFAAVLGGKVPVEVSGTLDVAVAAAAANAVPGDTVLLSPACASFDQFRDFEDRGDQFRALVEAL